MEMFLVFTDTWAAIAGMARATINIAIDLTFMIFSCLMIVAAKI